MIFTFTDADYGMDDIFNNFNFDIEKWKSVIPGPTFDNALLYDNALVDEFLTNSPIAGISRLAQKYLYNTVEAVRISIGKLASTVGFLKKEFVNLSNIFSTPTDDVGLKLFSLTEAIITSETFQNGLNAIGAVPIIGWIIQIIVKLAEGIYKLVRFIQQAKSDELDKALRMQQSIPLTEWSKDVDEEVTKLLLSNIRDFNVEYAFTPRNYFEDLADFEVVREKKSQNQRITDFFQIRSKNNYHGAGFVPGTTFLTSHIRLPTWYGGSGLLNKATSVGNIFDAGDLLPTVRNVCNQLYQIVQAIGPSLYTIRPDFLSNMWEQNIISLLEYNEESLRKGWSAWPTGCSPEIQGCMGEDPYYECSEEITGKEFQKAPSGLANPNCSKKGDIGKKIKNFPSDGHYLAFRQYIADIYFEGSFKDKNGKILPRNTPLKNIDISKARPITTLNVAKQRQTATIDSINCAYISLDVVNGNPRFPGLYHNNNFKQKWEKNLNLILNSQEWKKLVWRDIVDVKFSNAVAQKAKSENLEYDKEGPIVDSKTMIKAGPSVLPNPKVPAPVAPIGAKMATLSGVKSIKSSATSSSIAPLAGLGALAYFWMKK